MIKAQNFLHQSKSLAKKSIDSGLTRVGGIGKGLRHRVTRLLADEVNQIEDEQQRADVVDWLIDSRDILTDRASGAARKYSRIREAMLRRDCASSLTSSLFSRVHDKAGASIVVAIPGLRPLTRGVAVNGFNATLPIALVLFLGEPGVHQLLLAIEKKRFSSKAA